MILTRLIVLTLILMAAWHSQAEVVTFDKVETGKLPDGWQAGVTGAGAPKWTVETDASAPSNPNVLKQSGEGTYPWCVKKDVAMADGFVEVKFKPVDGTEDQAGGLVWRWKDGDHYDLVRANALEDNVTLYYVINGRRVAVKNVNVRVAPGRWHTLAPIFAEIISPSPLTASA